MNSDPITDEVNDFVMSPPTNGLGFGARFPDPNLVVGCFVDGNLAPAVMAATPEKPLALEVGETTQVQYRFDKEPPKTSTWTYAGSAMLISMNLAEHDSFVATAKGASKVVIRFMSLGEIKTFEYSLKGFSQALTVLRCLE